MAGKKKSVKEIGDWIAIPLSVIAIVIGALSWLEAHRANTLVQQQITDDDTILWHGETLGSDGALALKQPNDKLNVSSLSLRFPDVIRKDVIAVAPAEAQILPTWLEAGVSNLYAGCARLGETFVDPGVMPVQVETRYGRGEQAFVATYLYGLHYRYAPGGGLKLTGFAREGLVDKRNGNVDPSLATWGATRPTGRCGS